MGESVFESMVSEFDLPLRVPINQYMDRASGVTMKAVEKLSWDFGLS
jgi:hypothetical protein